MTIIDVLLTRISNLLETNNTADISKGTVSVLPKIAKTAVLLIASSAAGFLLDWMHAPLGWLLGPLIIGIVYALSQGSPQPLPLAFSIIGQAALGVRIASEFSWESLMMMANYAIPLLICIAITGSASILKGYLLCRFAGLDWSTGLLGSIPCIIPNLITLSEEVGADAIAVAILQYLRVLLIVVVVPIAIGLLFPGADVDSQSQASATLAATSSLSIHWNLVILVVCSGLGVWLGSQIRFPSSLFFGPLFLGLVACWILPYHLQVPDTIFAGALLLIGLSTGLQFNWQGIRKLVKAALIEVVLALLLILLCAGAAYEFHVVTKIDTITAILGSMPGGVQAMVASTVQFGGDPGLVVSMQMIRMFIILGVRSLLVGSLVKQEPSLEIDEATKPAG